MRSPKGDVLFLFSIISKYLNLSFSYAKKRGLDLKVHIFIL